MYINPQAKLFRHLDRLSELSVAGKTSAPINVEIDLSNRCSLGCEWCHFAHTHTRGPLAHKRSVETGDLMDTALILRTVDELAGAGVRSLVWSGGGEPTLHPDFDRIIQHCTLPQGMYTNGGHITPARAGLLKKRFKWVYVSLDAASGEDYARAKGVTPAHFERACQGIRELVAAEGSATIGVGFLLNADNWHRVRDMHALGQGLGVHYIQFRPTILYKNDEPSIAEGDSTWITQALYILDDMAAEDGVEIDLKRFHMLRDWSGHGYTRCWWSGLQTVITPDGRVWACLNKRGYEGAELGNLQTESFVKIWQRAPIQDVNGSCRVMCRGHVPNMTLAPLLEGQRKHEEFV